MHNRVQPHDGRLRANRAIAEPQDDVMAFRPDLLLHLLVDIRAGGIIVRQVGSTVHAGNNVGTGKDYTLFALIDGVVKYERTKNDRKKVSVYPGVSSDQSAAPASA